MYLYKLGVQVLGEDVGGSAGDAAERPGAKYDHVQRDHQCMWEGQVMEKCSGASEGDAAERLAAKRDHVQQDHQCTWEDEAVEEGVGVPGGEIIRSHRATNWMYMTRRWAIESQLTPTQKNERRTKQRRRKAEEGRGQPV